MISLGLGVPVRSRSGVSGGGVSYDADALDYFNRAEALDPEAFDLTSVSGDLTSDEVKTIWNTFVVSLKEDNTWDEVDEICPLSGVSFDAVTAKLKHSGNPVTNLINFLSGDYIPAGPGLGLKGDASTKEINSNWSPSDTITVPSGHHSMFTTEEASGISREGADPDNSMTFSGYFTFAGSVISDMFSSDGGRLVVVTSTVGFLLMNGTESSNRVLLDNSVATSGSPPTGVVSPNDYYFFSIGGSGFSDARRSIRTMGQGLTSGQEATLYAATSALMASLGYV